MHINHKYQVGLRGVFSSIIMDVSENKLHINTVIMCYHSLAITSEI